MWCIVLCPLSLQLHSLLPSVARRSPAPDTPQLLYNCVTAVSVCQCVIFGVSPPASVFIVTSTEVTQLDPLRLYTVFPLHLAELVPCPVSAYSKVLPLSPLESYNCDFNKIDIGNIF